MSDCVVMLLILVLLLVDVFRLLRRFLVDVGTTTSFFDWDERRDDRGEGLPLLLHSLDHQFIAEPGAAFGAGARARQSGQVVVAPTAVPTPSGWGVIGEITGSIVSLVTSHVVSAHA